MKKYVPKSRTSRSSKDIRTVGSPEVSFDTALYLVMKKLHEVFKDSRRWYANGNIVRDLNTEELLGVVDVLQEND